ncbi:hypothetical protein DP106_14210 [Halonotius pteroides]|uniref:Uncharacterized protein n=2 Tax=Halonotius pteroides TaxID=268735 RepID=A0A3A6PYX4_9EURY|nr:hypothetical protein DP106_14210 [Halonotius pteroides]
MRAIRDINSAPAKYSGSDRAEMPANKPLIAKVSGVSKDSVEYRLSQSGLGEDGMGLITVHPPSVEGRKFGPKSAELTDKGIRVLSALDEREESSTETIDQEEIKQLRARLDAIESTEFGEEDEVSAGKVVGQLEQVQTRIDELESMVEGNIQRFNEQLDELEARLDGEWGAVDTETAEDIGRTLNLSPVLFMLWSEVFGVDVRELVLQETITDELKAETQEDVLTAIERGLNGTGEVGGGSEISDVSRGSIPQQEESAAQGDGSDGQAELDETGSETTNADISPPDST